MDTITPFRAVLKKTIIFLYKSLLKCELIRFFFFFNFIEHYSLTFTNTQNETKIIKNI